MSNSTIKIQELIKQDLIYFIFMCSDEVRQELIKKPKDKTLDEYARIFCLGLIFNLKGVLLQTISELESVNLIDGFLAHVDTFEKDYEKVNSWVTEFIENIPDKKLKKCARNVWAQKQEYYNKYGFSIKKLSATLCGEDLN